MPIGEPEWWYAKDVRLMTRLLGPAARIFAAIATRRIESAVPYRSRLPVICVGNFTAGGTGKTPLTLHIARLLIAAGERPAILTRGYGGRRAGPCWIEDVSELAEDVGDEPLLLARAAPTMIARDRRAGAIAVETASTGPRSGATVIVMDDGLQNPSLAKDFTIAIVDGVRGFGNGQVIPAGPLRAPLDVQLELADAILVNIPPNARPESRETTTGGSVTNLADAGPARLIAGLRRDFPGPVLTASAEAAIPREEIAGRSYVAFAGIANPARFFALVERLGGSVVAHRTFKDHHTFGETDAEELLDLADRHGAELITTEKDHIRLVGYGGARERLANRARPLPIRLAFPERDGARLADLVMAAITTARSGA
ncbi:MAG: tetraacyldisaccharide 4'-kinase [Hyphomicrobiaceae bacterium]|nr:tetraacyldisaccharide 4'-kinase [Hyphomicrobiaceae bacterium]